VGNAVFLEKRGVGEAMPMAAISGAVAVLSGGLLAGFLRDPQGSPARR